MRRRVAIALVASIAMVHAPARSAAADESTEVYVVRLAEHLPASPATLAAVGVGTAPIYVYDDAVRGLAVEMTAAEAAGLRGRAGIVSVDLDRTFTLTADAPTDGDPVQSPPAALAGGPARNAFGGSGENVIIGVIDTGIWPEAASFSDRAIRNGTATGRVVYSEPPTRWHGTCEGGERFAPRLCNNKLIGARAFSASLDASNTFPDDEYHSPRDRLGHGTQVAAVAGGNRDVRASVHGTAPLDISGVAPRARIASYKAFFGFTGNESDILAAIDQAIADGVDVLNLSFGSAGDGFGGAIDEALLNAEEAGITIVASTGNDSIAEIEDPAAMPWVLGVSAMEDLLSWQGDVVLGDGTTVRGFSRSAPTGRKRLVDGAAAGSASCTGPLDRRVVRDRIVLCRIEFFDSSNPPGAVVARAGGAGMILVDADESRATAIVHEVPTVRVGFEGGEVVAAYLAAAGAEARARIDPLPPAVAPHEVALYTNRGPGVTPGITKPDVVAPGTGILTANAPTRGAYMNPGQAFAVVRGTSFSAPYAAGVAALVRERHPNWMPSAIRSAIITTADRSELVLQDGTPTPHWIGGAGEVRAAAVDPGLVYETTVADHRAAFEGLIHGADLNEPKIAAFDFTGTTTTSRTVTNVGPRATYVAEVELPPGLDVVVEPASFTLRHGERAKFTVTITGPDSLEYDAYEGAITWVGGGHRVRTVIQVIPPAPGEPFVDAPYEVSAAGSPGSTTFDTTFHYRGGFQGSGGSIVPADRMDGLVPDDPTDDYAQASASGQGVSTHVITIDPGVFYADLRVALYDDRVDGTTDNLDLYVYDPFGELVGSSAGATSNEVVDVPFAFEGDYRVDVHGLATDGPDAGYTLYSWRAGTDQLDPIDVAGPAFVQAETTAPVTVQWPRLEPNRYIAFVYQYGAGFLGQATIVSIDAEPPARFSRVVVDVAASGTSGTVDVPIEFGYDGAFAAVGRGLVASTVYTGTLEDGGAAFHEISVPPGHSMRVAMFTDDVAGAPIDFFVGDRRGVPVSHRDVTADHVIETIPLARPGIFDLIIFQLSAGEPSNYSVHVWIVPDEPGALTATGPSAAVNGTTGSVEVAWSGLEPARRYLGLVTYHSTASPVSKTDGYIGHSYVDIST